MGKYLIQLKISQHLFDEWDSIVDSHQTIGKMLNKLVSTLLLCPAPST